MKLSILEIMNTPAQPFQLCEKPNGRILKIHKTVPLDDGRGKRDPMQIACFSECQRRSVIVTECQQVYVFDYDVRLFWIVTSDKLCGAVTAVHFVPGSIKVLIVGTHLGQLVELDIETDKIAKSHRLSKERVLHIGHNSRIHPGTLVVHTETQIYLINPLASACLDKTLFASENPIIMNKSINMFQLDKPNMFVVFDGETIHIWNSENRRIVLQNHAIQLRDCFLSNTEDFEEVNLFPTREPVSAHQSDDEILNVCYSFQWSIMCVTFRDGLMLVSTEDNKMKVERFLKIPRLILSGCMAFNKTFYLVYTTSDLVIINPQNLQFKVLLEHVPINDIIVSEIGTKLAVLLETGECLIFDLLDICSSIRTNPPKSEHIEAFNQLNHQIDSVIPFSRLNVILREFNEFPQKYRSLIWKSLLKLPQNTTGFAELLKRQSHSCTASYPQNFPLKDAAIARKLSQTVSRLAHWCKVFGLVEFMPRFVFPFLKVFGNDSLLCFETIASILLNHGQLWFEFAPLEPTNYLGTVENILGHFEPKLLQFYRSKGITSTVYALSLVESAFTEVLSEPQWYALWDNIVASAPYFPIFCIVALNITLKTTITRMDSRESVEQLFDRPITTVDIAATIRLARQLMSKCPPELSPQQYFKPFQPLDRGQYQQFMAYPRDLADKVAGAKSISSVQLAVRLVNEKLVEMEKIKRSIEQLFDDEQRGKEHARRLEEVELAYESIVRDVERASIYNH